MYADKVGGMAAYAEPAKFVDNFTRGYDFLSIRALTPHKRGSDENWIACQDGPFHPDSCNCRAYACGWGMLQDVRRNAAGADCH